MDLSRSGQIGTNLNRSNPLLRLDAKDLSSRYGVIGDHIDKNGPNRHQLGYKEQLNLTISQAPAPKDELFHSRYKPALWSDTQTNGRWEQTYHSGNQLGYSSPLFKSTPHH